MRKLGVSKDTQKWAEKGIKEGSDRAQAMSRIQKADPTMWIPAVFNEKTSDRPIVSYWNATSAALASVFIEWLVPEDTVVLLGRYNKLLMRLYEVGGALLTERSAHLVLVFRKPTGDRWQEVCQIGTLGTWLDLDWLSQMNSKNKEALTYDLGHPFLLAYEGEQLGISITLPTEVLPKPPHEDSKFWHRCWYMSRHKFDGLKRLQRLRLPDEVKTGEIVE